MAAELESAKADWWGNSSGNMMALQMAAVTEFQKVDMRGLTMG